MHFYREFSICLPGDPGSQVWGSIRDGVFEGVIASELDGTFYVERAHKYFPRHNFTQAGFHSVIYHNDHVDDPYTRVREGHTSGCGVTEDVAAWMDSVQNSADLEEEKEEEAKLYLQLPVHLRSQYKYKKWLDTHDGYRTVQEESGNYGLYDNHLDEYHNKYSEEANKRSKRAVGIGVGEDNRGTCSLSIQTDPMLWDHISKQVKCDFILL